MTVLEWLAARRYRIGLALVLVSAVGAWFGPWPALGIVGLILAWNR